MDLASVTIWDVISAGLLVIVVVSARAWIGRRAKP